MIRLRPYKACDAKYIVNWTKDECAFHQWSADKFGSFPMDAVYLNDYYDNLKNDDNFFQMTAFDESGVIGHLVMRFTDECKNTVRFGFVIMSDEIRGKGYGKEMLRLSADYAYHILKADKITLGVFDNNPSAYHCYTSVGFVEVPERTGFYKISGEDWKCIEMELNRNQFLELEN